MSLIEQLNMLEKDTSFEASEVEFEFELYLENPDMDTIRSMSVSKHEQEQWGILVPNTDKNLTGGTIRVRRTIVDDGAVLFTQAIKSKTLEGTDLETEIVIDGAMFEHFSKMSDNGLRKVRYHVPFVSENGIELMIEFDTFTTTSGEVIPWVKVDVEIPEGIDGSKLVTANFFETEMKIEHARVIFVHPGLKVSSDPEAKKVLKEVAGLYEKYFVSGNKHL